MVGKTFRQRVEEDRGDVGFLAPLDAKAILDRGGATL
jgi:hypothetical protein